MAGSTPALPARARSVSLAGTFDCYIADTEVQADVTIFLFKTSLVPDREMSAFALRDYGGQPSITLPAASAGLACQP